MLEAVGMSQRIGKMEKQLDEIYLPQKENFSGGEEQRLILAKVLLKNAKIIVLDEATSAIDIANAEKVKKLVDSKRKENIIVIASHDNLFDELATQIIYI